jgi:hypothetical protein
MWARWQRTWVLGPLYLPRLWVQKQRCLRGRVPLFAGRYAYVELWRLVCLVDGRLTTLKDTYPHWYSLICEPYPKRYHQLGIWVEHEPGRYL